MRFVKITAAATMVTLIAGCASQQDSERIVVTGSRAGQTAVAPPPPPPPAAPSSTQATGNALGDLPRLRSGFSRPSSETEVSTATAQTAVSAINEGYRYVPPILLPSDPGREKYDGMEVSPVKLTLTEPVSTFSVDVDTGAYANARRFLSQGQMPPRDAVRTEEMINYFRYDYARPENRSQPFTVSTDVAITPWNNDTRLVRIGLRGYDLPRAERPPVNLVFLMDVSGSMSSPDKLTLVKTALAGLAGELQPQDRVSIVVYAGAAGLVLEPTNDTRAIRRALEQLQAGGSTAGGAGLQLAYHIAEDTFIEGGVNRVIIATDGDFNVGISDRDTLIEMIEAKRDSGITLTTLGFGSGNYNEALMEQIANHGNGNYAYIDTALEAKKVLGDEMSSTLFTIAKDVKIQVEFNPAVIAQYRLLGYENRILREEDFNNDAVDAGDIGAGHQVTAIYEVVPAGGKGWIPQRRYEAQGAAVGKADEAAYVKLRYKLPDDDTSRLIDLVIPSAQLQRAALPRGDFAFAAAVAAYGQKLRADPLLGKYDYADIDRLAGSQGDFWRQEFKQLAALAGGMAGN